MAYNASTNILTVGEVSMTTLDIGGVNVTSTAAEINLLDGVTSTTAELNLIDGGTARGTTAVASGDGILINDGGTMRMTNVDTVSTYLASHSVGGGNIVTTGALNSGSITSGFGTIDNGSSAITTTGLISGGSLDIDNVLINGTTIGHTDDTDLLTVASGVLTVAGELDATTLDISGNADIDGTLEADAITVDGITLAEYISDTAGAMFSSNTETGITATYQDSDNTIDLVIGTLNQDTTGTAATVTGAAQSAITSLGTLTALTVDDVSIDGKVITMTGSSSDTAVFTAGTNGTLSIVATDAAAAAANIQITADGTAELAGTTVTLDSAADIELEAANDINIPANVGLTFGDDGEKIEGDGTDLTITGNKINLESSDEVLFSGKLICTPVAYTNTSTNFSIFHGNWDTNAITTNTGTNMVMGMRLDVPNIVVGTAQPNLASTLYVNGAPTEAVKNYALHVDAGDCRFDGDIDPGANDSSSLGSSSLKWATIYAVTTNIGDLTLDNTWSDGNDVDGTTGNWTVQEGQSGLFLINNITGKHYKFNVSEVS